MQDAKIKGWGLRRIVYAGEFRVLAYGNTSIDELFEVARKQHSDRQWVASIARKESYVLCSIKDIMGLGAGQLISHFRNPDSPAIYDEWKAMYWDPDGPALAFKVAPKRAKAWYEHLGCKTPSNTVLFMGTSFIYG